MKTYVIAALACLLATSAHAKLPPNAWNIDDLTPYTADEYCAEVTRQVLEYQSYYRNQAAALTYKFPAINRQVYTVTLQQLPFLLQQAGLREEAAELVSLISHLERQLRASCAGPTASQ